LAAGRSIISWRSGVRALPTLRALSAQILPKERFARSLQAGSTVLDLGCWGFSFLRYCNELGIAGLVHSGVDREIPSESPPPGYSFERVDLETSQLPFPDGSFDAVVASHVIEHLRNPLVLMDEAFRVLKSDGSLYVECPSHRSLWLPSMPFQHEAFRSSNFYDDPTHLGRPQTPQSLFRLFRMYGAEVVEIRYLTRRAVRWRLPWLLLRACFTRDADLFEHALWWGVGFAVGGIARKTTTGTRAYVLDERTPPRQ
jgi:SAM-dependent methyltransferase